MTSGPQPPTKKHLIELIVKRREINGLSHYDALRATNRYGRKPSGELQEILVYHIARRTPYQNETEQLQKVLNELAKTRK